MKKQIKELEYTCKKEYHLKSKSWYVEFMIGDSKHHFMSKDEKSAELLFDFLKKILESVDLSIKKGYWESKE